MPVRKPSAPRRTPATRAALALGIAAAVVGAAAPTASAVGTRQLATSTALRCSSEPGVTVSFGSLTLTGSSPVFSTPGEAERLTDVHASVTLTHPYRSQSDGSPAFLNGRVTSLGLSATGATPAAFALPTPDTPFSSKLGPAVGPINVYAPIEFDLPDLPALVTSGRDSVTVSVDALTFQAEMGASAATPSANAPAITCSGDRPTLNLPNVAGTTGTQQIKASIPMTCTDLGLGRPGGDNDVVLDLEATVPAASGAAGQNAVVPTSLALRAVSKPGDLATGDYVSSAITSLTFSMGNGSYVSAGGSATERQLRTNGGWGPAQMLLSETLPQEPVVGAGPLSVNLTELRYSFITASAPTGPIPPLPPTNPVCKPAATQPALATIAAATAPPVSTPVVLRVYGNAWANIGGLIRVHGSKLAGAKYVTFGTKKVRPLLVIGSTDVWVLAPPLPKGTYPVAVGTATTVSPPGTGSSTTIAYR